ncbi:hypothetical protein LTS18_009457, partial [Coniosporium uncinatum]
MKPSSLLALRALVYNSPTICRPCQRRLFTPIARLAAPQTPEKTSAPPPQTTTPPKSPPKRTDEYMPPDSEHDKHALRPLGRPIGFRQPPKLLDNDGTDTRTNIEKRKDLTEQLFKKSYFRDWVALKHHHGKLYLANRLLFREDAALYFPNLRGKTLAANELQDTTVALRAMVSVVTVYQSHWGEQQAASFVSSAQNPDVRAVVAESGGKAQMVDINIEENSLKSG